MKHLVKSICRRCGLVDVVQTTKIHLQKIEVLQQESLKGKRILVTGGSNGIGLAMARKFLAEGAHVVVTGRDPVKLRQVVAEDATGRLQALQWDVVDFGIMNELIDRVFQMLNGRLDVLVNNAGIAERQGLGALTENVWKNVIETDLTAPIFITQAIVNRWLSSVECVEKGHVVLNISSLAGLKPACDAYSASKCALNSLTKGMAKVWAGKGVRINAIAPGVIGGTNIRQLQRSIDPAGDVSCDWIPIGRFGVPDEIAELAAFVISDRAAYMTGAVIPCDGCFHLK